MKKNDLVRIDMNDLISTDSGLIERHPGWWFKDIFSGLKKLEKAAWLELLTLAVASHPYGMVTFCSVKELATLLDIDEAALALVLEKAQKRWMIEIREVVMIPVPGESLELRRAYKQEIPSDVYRLFEEADKRVARFYVMVFPGFYFNRQGPLEERLSIIWENVTKYHQVEKHDLDLQLIEPLDMLQAKLAEGKASNYRTRVEVAKPFGSPSTLELPWEIIYEVGSADQINKRLANVFGLLLPLSSDNDALARTAVQVWFARFKMASMFSDSLSRGIPESVVRH